MLCIFNQVYLILAHLELHVVEMVPPLKQPLPKTYFVPSPPATGWSTFVHIRVGPTTMLFLATSLW